MDERQEDNLTKRKFLCVVDDSPECRLALRFAFRRAARTDGGVILLYVIEPADFQHWMAVENLMKEEAREEAESILQTLADEVSQWSGIIPEFSKSRPPFLTLQVEQAVTTLFQSVFPPRDRGNK